MKIRYLILVILIFSLNSFAQKSVQPELINSVPEKLPIKVEVILPEKVEDFPEKIKVKVTNIGKNPIYSVRLFLDMEDAPEKQLITPNGTVPFYGFDLFFGRKQLSGSKNEKPTENDVPMKPDETITLEINQYSAKITRKAQLKNYGKMPQFYRLIFWDLTFGDETGFTKNGAPFSNKAQNNMKP